MKIQRYCGGCGKGFIAEQARAHDIPCPACGNSKDVLRCLDWDYERGQPLNPIILDPGTK